MLETRQLDLPQPTLRLESACERALRGSTDGLWEWRVDGQTWCSPELWALLGFQKDGGDAPRDFTTLIHPTDYASVIETLVECSRDCQPFDRQFRVQTNIGEFRWFRAQAVVYHDSGGRPFSVSGSVKDITEFKLSAEASRERERRFYRRQRMDALDCLAGGISHEFNNLLQAIRGYISFAATTLDRESEAAQDLHCAVEAVDRATVLTRRLLDFARAEEQSEHVIDLRDTVLGLVDLVRPIIGGNIVLRSELSDQILLVRGDETSLRQALLNLCVNARDAMPEGGELLVRTEPFRLSSEHGASLGELKPGHYARIIVSDTGAGIPEQHRDKIFQPFYTTKEVGKGTGLGLPAVLGTVEAMGGHVELHTETGVGSTFGIYLPVEQADIPDGSAPSPAVGSLNLLLVEDDGVTREVVRRMLEGQAHTVTCADGAATAMEILRSRPKPFDLVVMDVLLPGTDGVRVLAEARTLCPGLPCVLCSGHGLFGRVATDDDDTAILHKPFDETQIVEAIQRSLTAKFSGPRPLASPTERLDV